MDGKIPELLSMSLRNAALFSPARRRLYSVEDLASLSGYKLESASHVYYQGVERAI